MKEKAERLFDAITLLKEDLVEEAQEKGELSRETPSGDIVDLVMGAYLTALFQWPGIGSCSRERCVERLDRLFRMVLAGVRR